MWNLPEASVALAESRDGIHWSEPVVVLKPSNESGWEERVNRPIVIHQADGYHMWYTGQTSWNSFIGHATSPDGVTWTRASQNPSLSPEQPWEKNAVMAPHVLWDAKKKVYKMWYSGGDQYEPDAIGYAESLDGQTWIRWPESVFTPSPKNQWDSYKVTGAQVMCNEGWYVMFYIGFRDMDHAQIGLARSRNGFSDWQRHPANPIIASGRLGAWDQDAIYKPFALLDNGHWYLWFNGRNGNVEQIGLATHAATDLGFGSDAIDDILSSNTSTCGQAND